MLKIKMKRMVTAIVIVAVVLIAIKFIMFPPVKEIPTTDFRGLLGFGE